MIPVNDIFTQVKELAAKDKAGYIDSNEFTRMSKLAELMLWSFYCHQYELDSCVPESMRVFIAEAALALNDRGQFLIPSDHGHRLQFWFQKVNNHACGDEPAITKVGIKYLEKAEEWATMQTSIRTPNLAKSRLYWTYVTGDKVQVYPITLKPSVVMEYMRYPTFAVRAFTLDVTNDEENYDAGTSTQYEWLEADRSNLIDLILLQVGLAIRETEITQFAAQHRAISQNVPQQ